MNVKLAENLLIMKLTFIDMKKFILDTKNLNANFVRKDLCNQVGWNFMKEVTLVQKVSNVPSVKRHFAAKINWNITVKYFMLKRRHFNADFVKNVMVDPDLWSSMKDNTKIVKSKRNQWTRNKTYYVPNLSKLLQIWNIWEDIRKFRLGTKVFNAKHVR